MVFYGNFISLQAHYTHNYQSISIYTNLNYYNYLIIMYLFEFKSLLTNHSFINSNVHYCNITLEVS